MQETKIDDLSPLHNRPAINHFVLIHVKFTGYEILRGTGWMRGGRIECDVWKLFFVNIIDIEQVGIRYEEFGQQWEFIG